MIVQWIKGSVGSTDDTAYTSDSNSVMARWSKYYQKLINVPGDIKPEALENIQKRSVNTALDEKPTMDQMVRAIKGLDNGEAPGAEGMKIPGSQFVQQTAPMNHQNMRGMPYTTSLEGCLHSHQLQKKETEQNVVIT